MNREAQDTLLLFVGVMVLQVGITDLHLRYVKPAMQVPLLVAGAVLTVVAVIGIVRAQRSSAPVQPVQPSPSEHVEGGALGADADGHDHAHMPRTAWLLALPLLVLTVVTPPSLGAYAVARGTQASIEEPTAALPPLPPPTDGAVDLRLTDYTTRAVYASESLEGQRVRLTGFVVDEGDRWSVARVAMSCCAADGRAVSVEVVGQQAPPTDTWVAVEGRWARVPGEGGDREPRIEADVVRVVEAPEQPYE